MKYCSECGSPVIRKIPTGDTIPRFVCVTCETIHYENPKIVVGCIPEWKDQILLCRRAIEPRVGLWTFPAGFMENDESVEEAAARETQEEAKAEVVIGSLFGVFSIVRVNQMYLVFRATMPTRTFGVGEESSEVKLFKITDIPWQELAFPVIHETLTLYCHDQQHGHSPVHMGNIG